jgi:hypothetical protein
MEWLLWTFAGVIAVYLILSWYFQRPFREPNHTSELLDPTNHPD